MGKKHAHWFPNLFDLGMFFITCHRAHTPEFASRNSFPVGEDVEKLEPSNFCTAGGNAKWCSHYGKQHGGSSKNLT